MKFLPVDRNSPDMLPTHPRLRDFAVRSLNYRLNSLSNRARSLFGKSEPERIYYRRLYNMNSPEWRAVRRLAEPALERLPDILMQDRVRQVLPRPDAEIEVVRNPVTETSRARLLIGLALNCALSSDE